MPAARLLPVLLVLAGCAAPYDPPFKGDHAAPAYQANLLKCRKQSSLAARRVANATPSSSVAALFSSDEPERADLRSCMVAKGYALQ